VVELVAQYVCVFNITGGPANASDASKPWPVLSALRWATSLSSVFKVCKIICEDYMNKAIFVNIVFVFLGGCGIKSCAKRPNGAVVCCC
jgi:hypothetical protein